LSLNVKYGKSESFGVLSAETGGARWVKRPIRGTIRPLKRIQAGLEVLRRTNEQITLPFVRIVCVG
jgi:hypothetical protein